MTDQQHRHLVLVARFPSPGTCKTRLIPRLGEEGACAFSLAALTDMLHLFATIPVHKTLLYTPITAGPAVASFLETESLQSSWEIQPQVPAADLGRRLRAALEHVQGLTPNNEWSSGSVTFVGMDCFDLCSSRIQQSMSLVFPTQAHMLPARDGGYVLLTVPLGSNGTVFDRIAWSCDRTASLQIIRLAEAGVSCLLGEMLDDVDNPEDLERLWKARKHKLNQYPRTIKYLETVMKCGTEKHGSHTS
ncbi:nucleotide-diphospho-sugar transferase [Lipomyces kononenkoae]|uniref:Nucleotide-diphospho-sugar transferase n=1 Tax=Lipomyces kononenkoae TaxID=34357 RepID=A0ACC3SYD8_LIPKO